MACNWTLAEVSPAPSKVCQSILNSLVRSGLQGLRVERGTLDGRLGRGLVKCDVFCGIVGEWGGWIFMYGPPAAPAAGLCPGLWGWGYGAGLFSTRTILHSSFLSFGVLIFALFLSIS
jgi:hypothetical protein